MSFHHWSAQRGDRHIEMSNFNVYRFLDGLVVERWEHIEDQQEHDRFWS